MYHIGDWSADYVFSELCVEIRTDKGWENPNNSRNETWDLSYYVLGMCVSGRVLAVEQLDWENPPGWAAGWETNFMIRKPEEDKKFEQSSDSEYSFKDLAALLA
jgi:phage terminase large subunit GpA-like protein